MIKLIYPIIKYLDSINEEKSLILKQFYPITNKTILENAYSISIGNIEHKSNEHNIYKLSNILDEKGKSYFPFRELDFDEDFLFRHRKEDNTIIKNQWNFYMNKVIQEICKNKNNHTKLYYILMKYLSNVPALNYEGCNISLFDVCKINSALCNCIERNKDKFILIKGDFSGIQKFIYKTKEAGALKTLKGRSLYLTLLQDLCAKYIIRELKLDISNILYSGGGNFYIIASENDVNKFEEVRTRLSEIILNAHKGEVYLALSYVKVYQKNFKCFSDTWKDVGDAVGSVKNNKWNEVGLEDKFNKIFGPIDKGGTLENSCQICGSIKKLNDNKICDLCSSFIELIENAKNKRIYIEEEVKIPKIKDKYDNVKDIFEAIGYKISFSNKYYDKKNFNETIYAINDFSDENVDGYTFKSVKFNSQSLDIIACTDKQLGDKKIGVLKLDVDNLGKLFIQTKNIGSVMGLSRYLSMFFEAYVEKTINSNNKYNLKTSLNWNNKITIIYAGGDDTFIVGRYDQVFEFTYFIRKIFQKYTCSDKMTFTAGVGMFNSNFPILRTAEITEGFLELGKDTEYKDKIVFMGQVFTWEEFNNLIELKNNIEEIYKRTGNKALFQKISDSTKGFKSVFKKGKNQINYIKIYNLAYYLRELRSDGNKDVQYLIDQLVENYEQLCLKSIKTDERNAEVMIIPYANKWAQCNCRKVEEERELYE